MSVSFFSPKHSKSSSQNNINENYLSQNIHTSLFNHYKSHIIDTKKNKSIKSKNNSNTFQTENFLSMSNRIFSNKENRKKITIKLENSQFCPLQIQCPYYRMCVMFEVEINKLMEQNDHLSQMCKIYSNNMYHKERLYKNMMFANQKIIKNLNKENKEIFRKRFETCLSESNLNNSNINNLNINNLTEEKSMNENYKKLKNSSSRNEIKKEISNLDFRNLSDAKNKFYKTYSKLGNDSLPNSPVNKTRRKINLKDNINLINEPLNMNNKSPNTKRNSILLQDLTSKKINRKYYDAISSYTKHSQNISYQNQTHQSFLSFQYDFTLFFQQHPYIKKLDEITKNDNEFLKVMNNAEPDVLIGYSDSISSLLKDYQEMIKINLRMKEFLKGSIDFVGSILNNDSNSVLLKNTCLILDCERTSLFILDKISDMLIVHSGEGLKKGQIKIPKDKGIVGSCFMSKKKLKIDEVYFDNRFDKEFDKKTNFRTKNILCYPLIDNDNECFGVIEAINKKNSKAFDTDDEELLKFFSLYASAILKNAINADENSNQISRVELILNYALEIQKIQKIKEFLFKTKELLYNLFSCVYAEIFLCENDEIYKYNDNGEKKFYNKNLGYIGIAYKSKKIYECSSTQNSIYYNDLIDMESANGLLTFPIVYNEFFKGIIQVPYHSKPNNDGKPRSNEVYIIKLFNKSFIEWYNIHNDNI